MSKKPMSKSGPRFGPAGAELTKQNAQELRNAGIPIDKVAERVGMSPSWVALHTASTYEKPAGRIWKRRELDRESIARRIR